MFFTSNPKVEIAKIVPPFVPPVFAKNIGPTHGFGGYLFVNVDGAKGLEFAGGARFAISTFGLGYSFNVNVSIRKLIQ